MLLGADDHAWPHESHERNHLVGGEAMAVDEIGTNQAPCPPKTSFAVDSNALLLNSNRLMGQADELPDNGQ